MHADSLVAITMPSFGNCLNDAILIATDFTARPMPVKGQPISNCSIAPFLRCCTLRKAPAQASYCLSNSNSTFGVKHRGGGRAWIVQRLQMDVHLGAESLHTWKPIVREKSWRIKAGGRQDRLSSHHPDSGIKMILIRSLTSTSIRMRSLPLRLGAFQAKTPRESPWKHPGGQTCDAY